MTRTLIGAAAAAAGSFVLWLVLGMQPNVASISAGLAVAAAIGVWALVATM